MVGVVVLPRCRVCGNRKSFGVSAVDPPSDTAQGPVSGLWGEFDSEGRLLQVMSTCSDNGERDILAEEPDIVDICMECGSRDIVK